MTDLVRLPELDAAWSVRGAGARLEAVRRAGRKLRERMLAGGTVRAVRTADIATFPYPTRYGLQSVASSPAPYVFMRNRMHLVQVAAGGRVVSILVNPTDAERSRKAPYFARLIENHPIANRMLAKFHTTVERALGDWGVAPDAIDYVTFDHLHVQDVRGLLGGERPFLPNAKLLAMRAEL